MKWTQKELEIAIKLISGGATYKEIAIKLDRTIKAVRVKLNRLNYYYTKLDTNIDYVCESCGKLFSGSPGRKFCSKSCSATFNNRLRLKRSKICLNCGKDIPIRNTYCGNHCRHEFQWKQIVIKIESGDKSLSSRLYKKYLIEKYGEKCMICGWDEINPITNKVPIELEHIDGNSENNVLNNLELLCPNHHSLTTTYRALNTGNGRHSRRVRYKENKSY